MVHLPDTPGDWEEHTHTSGRIFLSNPATSETRWLWQKWDMKGRLFVRNIADPAQQIWVDQMDVSMRLKSGTASQDEVARYIAYTPPPPPPTSLPQNPPQHHWQQPPPRRDPHFDRPAHQYPQQHHFDHQNGFGHKPPHPYHHDINSESHRHTADPYFSKRAPENPDYRHHDTYTDYPTAYDSRKVFGHPHQTPHPANTSQPTHHHPIHSSNLDSMPYRPAPIPPLPSSSEPLHGDNPDRKYQLDRQSNNSSTHNHNSSSDIRSNHQSKSKKRPHSPEVNAHGRYWSNEHKQGKKRSRTATKSDSLSKSSRFAPIPESLRPRSPRPAPRSPKPDTLSGDLYGSFQPNNRAAQNIVANCIVEDVSTVGLLHDRDFKSTIAENPSSPSSVRISSNGGDEEYSFAAVVGTCEEIEKDYLRLTSAPKPEAVRPPHVLIKSLEHIKSLWRHGNAEYDWACRQLKSVRQDYKVQHVKDMHVVDVYETHARIALENNDLGEFNTCVAQVQELYRFLDCPQSVQDEFACYRILYNVLVKASQWEQGQILRRFTGAERNRPATRFALKVRHAIATGNYRNYFMLCSDPPPKTMVSYLLVHLNDRIRFRAASVMTAAYGSGHPGLLPLRYILNQMGWVESNQPSELIEPVLPESVVQSDDSDINERIRALSTQKQPAWVCEALIFILGSNIACIADPESKEHILDRVQVDFKKTKAQGLRERKTIAKLITHAGSEDVKLMK